MKYFDEIRKAMNMLALRPNTVFVGQSVMFPAHAMFKTLQWENGESFAFNRIEMPVCEDFQMGFCTGLALAGKIPICIFPRMDFMLLATNQLVNHLDKIPMFSDYWPKVIIRTAVGAKYPRYSGIQQSGDYIAAFRLMLKTVNVIELNSKFDVEKGYREAALSSDPVLVVERMDLYNE